MVTIDQEKCIGCGLCAADCIALNIEIKKEKAYVGAECLQCGHCVAICPENAVAIPEYDMADVEEYEKENFQLDPKNVLHAIKFRRSVRSYRREKIRQEDLAFLLQAGRYTATAKNNQDCCFVFVQEELGGLKDRVWSSIDALEEKSGGQADPQWRPYISFNRRRKTDPADDYLFRDAPAVLFITSTWPLDAGLAAQNIEMMAASLGMGVLYNGFLARAAEADEELKKWLGIEGRQIRACMLLGYPDRQYRRTAPRRAAHVIWK